MDDARLCVSFPFDGHPIKNAPLDLKSHYLNALRLMVLQHGDGWSQAALGKYAERLFWGTENRQANADLATSLGKLSNIVFLQYNYLNTKALIYAFVCDVLFLTAFADPHRAKKVVTQLQGGALPIRLKVNIQLLASELYIEKLHTKTNIIVKMHIDTWHKNLVFSKRPLKRIIVTAITSTGKSTLINALAGKDVFEARNAACTSFVQKVYTKPLKDGVVFKHGLDMAIYSEALAGCRICFIDTPGVNAACFPQHQKITQGEILGGQYDYLLYVLSMANLGTIDDAKHLEFVSKNVPASKIIFVLNKMDTYDEEASIAETIEELRSSLRSNYGIASPAVYPISAKAARLAKLARVKNLKENEKRFYDAYRQMYMGLPFNLSEFYPNLESMGDLQAQCGITGLEQALINL